MVRPREPHLLDDIMGPGAAERLRRLRESEPVCPVRLPNGEDAWLVTRYDDVAAVLSDPRFSRLFNPGGSSGRHGDRATPPNEAGEARTLGMDGAPHRALRAVVGSEFTPRRIDAMRPAIQRLTDGLVEGLRRHGPPADLVEMFAAPLPITVICELLGVPAEDAEKFRGWSDRTLSVTAYSRDEVVAAWGGLIGYFTDMVARKRERPGTDLLSALVAASDGERRLTETELVYLAVGLLIGGHESTINAIGLSVLQLLRDPAQADRIRSDPALVEPAVEELLRFQTLGDVDRQRFAREDVELSGVTIGAGEMVLAGVMAANRDAARFADAEELDVGRHPNPHLSFGLGPHFCLGAALARAELQIALGTLLRAFPGLRLADPGAEPPRRTGLMVSGLEELRVVW
ncbi:cytochrome P450 [Actinomadura parmotrematis]|uniref:Cytochrome P450 n=1 Tax=Actinomadura parmotrematis TaxID=2864039 RepID=A0ABS7FX93_9ACTN|nr:cytochrome P450 [Actinomadura parmotrematis]MBW8484299.1 cytochrome P450 [Actinomadura parmotrematis]